MKIGSAPFLRAGVAMVASMLIAGKLAECQQAALGIIDLANGATEVVAAELTTIFESKEAVATKLEELAGRLDVSTLPRNFRNTLYSLSGVILALLGLEGRLVEAHRVKSGGAGERALISFLNRLSIPSMVKSEDLRNLVLADGKPVPSCTLRDLLPDQTVLFSRRVLTGEQVLSQWCDLDSKLAVLPPGVTVLHLSRLVRGGKISVGEARSLATLDVTPCLATTICLLRGPRVEPSSTTSQVVVAQSQESAKATTRPIYEV